MKSKLIVLLILVIATSTSVCAQTTKTSSKTTPKVEVIYFHATNRCPTCLAIENNAKKTIETYFKTELSKGLIKFTSVNIDDKANKALVEKYQVAFSSMFIVRNAGGKETKTDFTDNAFQYARTNPEKYAEMLKAEIRKNLI